MIENCGKGLLIISAFGFKQLSVYDGKVFAGGKNLDDAAAKNLTDLNWYYDSEIDSWVFDTVGAE